MITSFQNCYGSFLNPFLCFRIRIIFSLSFFCSCASTFWVDIGGTFSLRWKRKRMENENFDIWDLSFKWLKCIFLATNYTPSKTLKKKSGLQILHIKSICGIQKDNTILLCFWEHWKIDKWRNFVIYFDQRTFKFCIVN